MKKIRFKFLSVFAFCFLFFHSVSAQNVTEILEKTSSLLTTKSDESMLTRFSLHIHNKNNQLSESFEGTIHIKDNKFFLQVPDMLVWFDGKTQWTYILHTEEVNITEPSEDELQYLNPSLLLRQYQKRYTASLEGECTTKGGKGAYDILLTPKKKGEITTIHLQIEKTSSQPARIVIETRDETKTNIQIDKMQIETNQSDNTFIFNKKEYPDAEIIDLR